MRAPALNQQRTVVAAALYTAPAVVPLIVTRWGFGHPLRTDPLLLTLIVFLGVAGLAVGGNLIAFPRGHRPSRRRTVAAYMIVLGALLAGEAIDGSLRGTLWLPVFVGFLAPELAFLTLVDENRPALRSQLLRGALVLLPSLCVALVAAVFLGVLEAEPLNGLSLTSRAIAVLAAAQGAVVGHFAFFLATTSPISRPRT